MVVNPTDPLLPYVSDDLTHFVGRAQPTDDDRFALLKAILESGTLRRGPSSAMDRIDPRASISQRKMYVPNIVCFCDIPMAGLGIHMQKYGHFGIAFPKRRLARYGASPVFYVARTSAVLNMESLKWSPRGEYFDEMVRRFHVLMEKLEDEVMMPVSGNVVGSSGEALHRVRSAPSDDPVVSVKYFFESEVLPFVTFFDEQLGDDDPDNYYMEREWRKRGEVKFVKEDVSRLIMPRTFAERFRQDAPEWRATPIHLAEDPSETL